MSRTFRFTALAFLLGLASHASAQLPIVDITLVDTGTGSLEVRLRPDAAFDGIVSAVVFTVRWSEQDAVSLGAVSQVLPEAVYCGVAKSGSEQVDGLFRYQVFAGFGTTPLSSLGTSWSAGEEIVLCTIAGPSTTMFQLVNDDWTLANNGNYFISLNGETRTGIIYTIITGMPDAASGAPFLHVVPNPTSGAATITARLPVGEEVDFELTDAAGRTVWSLVRAVGTGTVRQPLDLTGLSDGAYVLRMRCGNELLTQRVVLAAGR